MSIRKSLEKIKELIDVEHEVRYNTRRDDARERCQTKKRSGGLI
jgi:hypothetical protein